MVTSGHESRFRYALERPYPFSWFTPVAAVAGVCAVILFSFVNIAADGYVQSVVYTTSPNSTLAEEHWYGHPPWSWISTAKSSCQSPGISIGSFYYTSNQEAGSYTVTNMNTTLGPGEDAIYPGLTSKTLGITTYSSNTLNNCTLSDMMVIFTSQGPPSSAKLMIQVSPLDNQSPILYAVVDPKIRRLDRYTAISMRTAASTSLSNNLLVAPNSFSHNVQASVSGRCTTSCKAIQI